MDTDPPAPISPFERIRHQDDVGEYWSARELAALLDYADWRNFEKVIKKAMTACEGSRQQISDHFVAVNKMVELGSGSKRKVKDYQLSRYACYLIVENADPNKEIVALGQTYFAIRTRRDELADDRDEARKRVEEREKLKRYHRVLYRAARAAGVITPEDFAIFEDHGYHETVAQIAERKGLKPGQHISDHMGAVELAANGLRAALAAEVISTEGIQDAQQPMPLTSVRELESVAQWKRWASSRKGFPPRPKAYNKSSAISLARSASSRKIVLACGHRSLRTIPAERDK
jgi:DNA-damage-inducible protein D